MSRLIDADLLGLTDMEIIMCDGDYKEALKMLIDKIEHAPTIEPEQRWIPVTERLPEEEGEYLITDDSGGIKTIEVDSFMFFEDGTKDWCYSQNAIAWMPLPEPWKGEQNE